MNHLNTMNQLNTMDRRAKAKSQVEWQWQIVLQSCQPD